MENALTYLALSEIVNLERPRATSNCFHFSFLNNTTMECARNYVLVSKVSKWIKCVISLRYGNISRRTLNRSLVDCTLNKLSEASFWVIKHTHTISCRNPTDAKDANLVLITSNHEGVLIRP